MQSIELLMMRKISVFFILLLFLLPIVVVTVINDTTLGPVYGRLFQKQGGASTPVVDNQIIDCENPIEILFIGSSYFFYNNLPSLFENLVISSGKEVYIDQQIINGLYLDHHASSSATESKINELKWDYVILQGVGSNMAYPDYFTDHPVYPALVYER